MVLFINIKILIKSYDDNNNTTYWLDVNLLSTYLIKSNEIDFIATAVTIVYGRRRIKRIFGTGYIMSEYIGQSNAIT